MRVFALLALILLLAWGVWQLVGDDDLLSQSPTELDGTPDGPDPGVQAADERVYAPGTLPTTGTLVVTVMSMSKHIPEGARAGYVYGGRDRLRPVNERGQVTFSDAPLGYVDVVARAPGFERKAQRYYLNAGVPAEVPMVLTLKKGFVPGKELPKDR